MFEFGSDDWLVNVMLLLIDCNVRGAASEAGEQYMEHRMQRGAASYFQLRSGIAEDQLTY